jgi:hypothetical protein
MCQVGDIVAIMSELDGLIPFQDQFPWHDEIAVFCVGA